MLCAFNETGPAQEIIFFQLFKKPQNYGEITSPSVLKGKDPAYILSYVTKYFNILLLFTFPSYSILKPSWENHISLLIWLLRKPGPYLVRPSDIFSLEIYIFLP